jgi:hypothetical protein
MQSEATFEIDEPVELTELSPSTEPSILLRLAAIVGVIGLYAVYRVLRVEAGGDVFERGLPIGPFRHALTIVKVERWLWLDFELGWQRLALHHGLLIRLSDAYYAWAHQALTFGLAVCVLLRAPWARARYWIGAVLVQLPLALVMFAAYPLMPPRLLDAGVPWGGRALELHRRLHASGFVDSLVKVSGPWSPAKVGFGSFTNQFAALPSLHCGFSLWVAVVWWQWAKGRSWRFIGPLHAIVMFWCVLVTGNHFVLDAVAGWAVAIVALLAVRRLRPEPVQPESGLQGESNLMPSISSTWQ